MSSNNPSAETKTVLVWCSWIAVAGGMERVAASIANGLHSKGWRVLFVGPCDEVPSFRSLLADGVEVVSHTPRSTVSGSIRTARFLNALIKKYSVDLVSAHGSVLPLIACPVPVVWTEHEIRYGGQDMLSGVKGLIWRVIRHHLQTGRWKLIVVSRFLRDQTCEKLGLDAALTSLIYYGIADADNLRQIPLPALKPPYRIGFLGRLISYKGPLDIFELMPELDRLGVPHEWHIFGEGDLLPELRERAAAFPGRITVHGPVPNARHALSQVDMIAFLSRGEHEGLGLVLVEARLARRLVTAWNVGCIPEGAGEDAALVDAPFDLKRFAARMAAELRRGELPPPVPADQWTVQTMINQYDAHYAAFLAESRAGPGRSAAANSLT
jgi:glycosyltransferase involved in cell wall biosynthesis